MNNYYLEVMVDDEAATLKQLNKLCGIKHDIFLELRCQGKDYQ
jgi:hypothetical protein